jgi:HD-like signal output (HDOD) protein
MSNALRKWTKTLGNHPLPAMTPSSERVAELLERPNTTNTDLQQAIDLDPGFALAIFRSITTATNIEQEPPHTLSHAISLLGLPSVGRIMKGLTILLGTKHVAYEGLIHCYSRAIHAAHYAREWGRQRGDTNPEEMWLAALFYSCGEMALWAHAEDKMSEIESLAAKGRDYNSAAVSVLGFSFNQLSHALATEWRLPTLTTAALESCWPQQPRTLEVVLATSLARYSEQSWDSAPCQDVIEHLAQSKGESVDHITSSMHQMSVDTAREMEALPLPLTATQFLSPQVKEKPVASGNRLQKLFGQHMLLLRKNLGLQRVVFAILSSDRKYLKTRFVMGADDNDPIRRLSIPLGSNTLFAIMLKKPQGVWLNAATKKRFLPIIPDSIHKSIDIRGFFSISLFVRNKPIGILYADAREPDSLTDEQFKLFKRIGLQLSQQLSKAD